MSIFGTKKESNVVNTPYVPTSEIGKLQVWYASVAQQKGWDCSGIGFYNWMKKNRPELL